MTPIKLMQLLGIAAAWGIAATVMHGQDVSSMSNYEQMADSLDTWSKRGEHTSFENEQIQKLPKESVRVISDLLRHAYAPPAELKLMHVLSYKLREFSSSITTQTKQTAIKAIIEKCQHAKEEDISIYLISLEYLSDADFRQIAAQVKSNKSQKVRSEIEDFVQHRRAVD